MSTHAVLSPSSAERWMNCYGSVELSKNIVDTGSSAANEGTMMHTVSATCLEKGYDAVGFIGTIDTETGLILQVSQANYVQDYVDYVRTLANLTGAIMLIEQSLPIGFMTGEDGAHGTADAIIITEDELIIVDAKFGFKTVDAVENKQLQIYAAAAYEIYGMAYDFKTVRLVIVQPRGTTTISEWVTTPKALMIFSEEVSFAADTILQGNDTLVPTEKGCQWCKAKATCPAIRNKVLTDFETIVPETAESEDLSRVMENAGLIESWIKSIRAEVERRLMSGTPVAGYKLVQGKRGNRKWGNPEEAESTLKDMSFKHEMMYDYTLVSPTSIEKLVKSKQIDSDHWIKIQELITQSEGYPSVAPESDKRPVLNSSADDSDFDKI
jgi:hypothetical protein